MPEPTTPARRSSGVLDAILDRVDAKEELREHATVLFRAKALEQLDVATEIDNQLPLVSRRTWLVVAGVVVLCAAALVWAAFTPTQKILPGVGRVVAPAGVISISPATGGTLAVMLPQTGEAIEAGQEVTRVDTSTGSVPVTAVASGTMWQALSSVGDAVGTGDRVGTILPDGSDRTALVPISETAAATIEVGMRADVPSASPVTGVVTALSAPLPPATVEETTGLSIDSDGTYVIATIALDSPLPAGTEVPVRIIQSERSILSSLLGGA